MYGIAMSTPQQFGAQLAVTSTEALDWLIKQSEMDTGKPGREVQLRVGREVRRYRVELDGDAYRVTGLSPNAASWRRSVSALELKRSQFGIAMKEHRLFTPAVVEGAPCCCATIA